MGYDGVHAEIVSIRSVGWVSVALLLVICVMVAYQLAYDKVILPRVIISGVEVSNMDKEAAKLRLAATFGAHPNRVKVAYRGKTPYGRNNARKINFDGRWSRPESGQKRQSSTKTEASEWRCFLN